MRKKENPSDTKDNTRSKDFVQTARFEDVIKHYKFDAALRHLVLQALEQIEVSLKIQWMEFFSLKYNNPLFFFDPQFYNEQYDKTKFCDIISMVKSKYNKRTKDDYFIKSYASKRPNIKLPEAWIITEIFSFSDFLRFVYFLKPKYKKKFCDHYIKTMNCCLLPHDQFIILLKRFLSIRNICAHNGRLWNRSLPFSVTYHQKQPPALKDALNTKAEQKLYNALCYINYFLRQIDSSLQWQNCLIALINEHPEYTYTMGFPLGWQTKDLWMKI